MYCNLDDVINGATHALQCRGKEAANNFGRGVLNTTFGVGGIVDLASMNGMPKGEGDFGQTFGVWGVGPGPYIVLPLMGPSNARDTVGRVARAASDPRTYMPDPWAYSLRGAEFVQIRADNLENTNLIDSSSLDKYGFTRSLYMQRRDALVKSGKEAAAAR